MQHKLCTIFALRVSAGLKLEYSAADACIDILLLMDKNLKH